MITTDQIIEMMNDAVCDKKNRYRIIVKRLKHAINNVFAIKYCDQVLHRDYRKKLRGVMKDNNLERYVETILLSDLEILFDIVSGKKGKMGYTIDLHLYVVCLIIMQRIRNKKLIIPKRCYLSTHIIHKPSRPTSTFVGT